VISCKVEALTLNPLQTINDLQQNFVEQRLLLTTETAKHMRHGSCLAFTGVLPGCTNSNPQSREILCAEMLNGAFKAVMATS
jgi:hypothetical protein